MSAPSAWTGLIRLARDTVADPREGATTVLSFAPGREALWTMFALVVVVTMFLGTLADLIVGLRGGGGQMLSPVMLGLIQGGLLLVMVLAVHHLGRAFGGTGRFDEALLLVVWLQFIFILIQAIQIVALVILPPVAPLITLLSMALFFWLLVNFIAVLHGFTSLGRIFLMVILSIMGLGLVMTILTTVLGFGPQGVG